MNTNDIEFTKQWWRRTTSDQTKLTAWLQKLQRTEYSGYADHLAFLATHTVSDRERKILENIAEDEHKHSGMLIDLLDSRGCGVGHDSAFSTYWDDVLSNVQSTADYCAANYFGEALASFRFEIILSMPETPTDIREVLSAVLPDEIFHRETLIRLAGDDAIESMRPHHDAAVKRLRGG